MILGLVLAAVVGSARADHVIQLETALGNLAYTIGACERVVPDQSADGVVLTLTGANLDDPTVEQRQYRALFTGLFVEGRASGEAGTLSAGACNRMITELTDTLHDVAADKTTL